MSIEQMVNEIQRIRREEGDFVLPAASELEIATLASEFENALGIGLPEAYRRVLRCSNGVLFDGLTLWPTRRHALIEESLVDANLAWRRMLRNDLVYFGKRDDSLYAYDHRDGAYVVLGLPEQEAWDTFEDLEQMIEAMLGSVVDVEASDE